MSLQATRVCSLMVEFELDRPERRNAIDSEVANAFVVALAEVRNSDVVVAVLRASSPVFCAGNDLHDLGPGGVAQAPLTRFVDAMVGSGLFWITIIDGAALGGALSLVAASQVVLAGERATFSLPEAKLGLFPAAIFGDLEGLLGPRRAFDLSMRGDSIGPEEAVRLGLVTEATSSDQLTDRLDSWLALATADPELTRSAAAAWNSRYSTDANRARRGQLDQILDRQLDRFGSRQGEQISK